MDASQLRKWMKDETKVVVKYGTKGVLNGKIVGLDSARLHIKEGIGTYGIPIADVHSVNPE